MLLSTSTHRHLSILTPFITSRTQLEELAAFVALLRAQPIPADRLATIAEELGSAVELIWQLRDGEWTNPAAQREMNVRDDALWDRSYRDAEEWLQQGYDVRTVFDDDYPTNLRAIFNRPPFVFVRGTFAGKVSGSELDALLATWRDKIGSVATRSQWVGQAAAGRATRPFPYCLDCSRAFAHAPATRASRKAAPPTSSVAPRPGPRALARTTPRL